MRCSKPVIYFVSFSPHNDPIGGFEHNPPFIEKETDSVRGIGLVNVRN